MEWLSIPENVNFRTGEIPEVKWEIMIKEVIQQEVIRILNVYEPKKKKSLKRMEHICIREKEKK